MSREVDERIVKMTLDNSSFEQPAKKSMTTLGKLKQAMLFSDATKGLDSWQSKMDKLNMDKVMDACDTVTHKFSVFGTIADETIRRVTRRVEDMVSATIKAATIEPVSDGFKEYELKMGSIQTIMAGTGESLQTVNKYLNELNTYSDKTIYSFSDMTNNIGKFTNAGVKLKDAVAAIQGVANVAAVSGANAGEASRAMYNFSQALSTGSVKLIDWKSIENANMATVEFKDTLLQCAAAMGTAEKTGDGMYKVLTTNLQGKTFNEVVTSTKNFNDSLQYQWMSTKVLTEALSIYSTDLSAMSKAEQDAWRKGMLAKGYTDAQVDSFAELSKKAFASATEIKSFSMLLDTLKEALGSGWAMSWEIMLGDFEQAKALWTSVGNSIGNVISKVDNARNDLLRATLGTGWEHMTGDNFIGELTEAGEQIRASIPDLDEYKNRILAIAVAKNEVSTEDADGASDTMKWNDLLHKGQISAESFTDALYDMRDSYKNMSDAEREQNGITEDMVQNLERYCRGVENGTISIEAFAGEMMQLSGRENIIQGISNIFKVLSKLSEPVKEAFSEIFGTIDTFSLKMQTVRFREFTEKLMPSEHALTAIKITFEGIFAAVRLIGEGIGVVGNTLLKFIQPTFNLIDSVVSVIGRLFEGIAKISGTGNIFENVFGGIKGANSGWYKIIDTITAGINAMANGIRNFPDSKIFTGVINAFSAAGRKTKEYLDMASKFPIATKFVNLAASAYSVLGKIVSGVVTSLKKVGSSAVSFFSGDKSSAVSGFMDGLASAIKTLGSTAGGVGNVIITFLKGIFNVLKSGVGVVKDFFKNMKFDTTGIDKAVAWLKGVVSNITPAKVLIAGLVTLFSSIAIGLTKILFSIGQVTGSVGGVLNSISETIESYKNKNNSNLMNAVKAIVAISAAFVVLAQIPPDKIEGGKKALITVTGCVAVLTGLVYALEYFMTKASSVDGAEKAAISTKSIITVVALLIAATSSLKSLSKLDIGAEIFVKIGALVLLIGVMVGALVAMQALPKMLDKLGVESNGGFTKGIIAAVGLSAAVYLLSKSLSKISNINANNITTSLKNIGILLAGVGVLTLAASKIGLTSGVALLVITIALTKIVPVLEELAGHDFDGIASSLKKYSIVLIGLAVMMGQAIVIASLIGSSFDQFSNGLLKASASILILAGAAKIISSLKMTDVTKAEQFIGVCGGMLAAFLVITAFSSRLAKADRSFKDVGIAMAGAAAMLVAVGIVMKLIAPLNAGQIIKGMIVTGLLMGLIDLMMVISSKSTTAANGSFKSVAVALSLLVVLLGEVVVMSMMDFDSMLKTVGLVAGVMAVLSAMLRSLPTDINAGVVKSLIVTMLGTIVMLGGLMAGIGILKSKCGVSPEEIKSVFQSAALVLGSLAVVNAIIGRMPTTSVSLKTILPGLILFAGVAGAMGIIAGVLGTTGSANWQVIAAIAGSVAVITPILTACIAGLSLIGGIASVNVVGMLVAVASGLLLLAGIGLMLTWMANNVKAPDNLSPIVNAISSATITMIEGLTAITAVGAGITATGGLLAAGMVGALLIGMVMMAAISLGLNWLVQNASGIANAAPIISQISSALDVLIPALGALTAIGVGGAFSIAGIGSMIALLAALFAVCGVLSQFTQFTDSLQAGGNVLSLLAGVLGDALGSLVASFGEAATSGLPQIGQNLSDFGNNLQPFLDAMGKVKPEHIDAAQNLASIVTTLAGSSFLDTAEGLFTKIGNIFKSDEDDNSTWTEGITKTLTGFATGVAGFATEIDKIDDTVLDKADIASQVLAKMVEASKSIGNSGGIFDKIFGSNNLDDFGSQIKSFGESIAAFAESVNKDSITEDAVSKAGLVKNILNAMSEVAKAIPNSGGVSGWWNGENDIDDFASKLTDMMCSLCGENGFLQVINDNADLLSSTSGNVNTVTDILKSFVDIANAVPNSDGIVSWFTGDNDILDFTDKLPDVGTDIVNFATNIKGIADDTSSKAFQAKQALSRVVELAAYIKEKKVSNGTITSFMKDVDSFTTSAYNLSVNLVDFDSKTINAAMATVKNMVNTFNAYSDNSSNIQTIVNSLDTLGKMSLSDFAQSILTYAPTISDNFNQIFEDMKTCMDEQKEAMLKMIPEFVKAVSDTFATEFKSDANVGTIKTAIDSMFTNVTSGMTDSIKKKFADVGKAIVAGIKEGIEKNRQQAIDSMNKLIKETSKTNTSSGNKVPKKSASSNSASSNSAKTKAMKVGDTLSSRVSAVINSDSASDLTITPVMDTSSIDRSLSRLTARISNMGNYIPYANDISATARMKYSGASGYKEESTTAETNANGNGNNVTFVQNNYSPKALDELTVYRNTRRQVSQMKGLVTT